MRRGLRRGSVAVAVGLLIAGLAACAPETDPSWSPAEWPSAGAVVDGPPAAEAVEATLADMRLQNDDVGIDARWGRLPGEHPINGSIETFVRDAVSTRIAESGVAYLPQAHAVGAGLDERGCADDAMSTPAESIAAGRTGTVVVCQVVLARGSVFAESLRAVSASDGVVTSDTTTTLYTDTRTGDVGAGQSLFADPSALWVSMIDVLRRDAGGLGLSPVSTPSADQLLVLEQALAGAVLAGGAVTLPVPSDLTAIELDGLAAWATSPDARPAFVSFPATGLTPLGQAVAAASGAFEGPAARGFGFEDVPCDLVPCMAVTLDDGPSPLTPGFLDVLRDHQAAATFYMLGQEAQAYPDMVRRVAAEGHMVGNHTWNHPHLTKVPPATVTDQISRTGTVLRELSGQPVETFRPPGGMIDDAVLALVGMPAIMWSVDTRDWAQPGDDELRRYAIDEPAVGSILLMHDIQPVSSRVFPDVIAGLSDRGFALVTIDQLFDGAVPGGVVRHGPRPD